MQLEFFFKSCYRIVKEDKRFHFFFYLINLNYSYSKGSENAMLTNVTTTIISCLWDKFPKSSKYISQRNPSYYKHKFVGGEYYLEQASAYLPENGFEVVNSLSEGLEGIPTWLDLHSVQRDKGSVKEWQEYIIF